jgi:hypothetical protein
VNRFEQRCSSANSGEGKRRPFPPFERVKPCVQALPKRIDSYPAKIRRQRIEPPQRVPQKRRCSNWILSLPMMKRRRHLNQRLQKRLLLPIQFEPNGFPVLVGMPELFAVIAAQSFG